MLATILILIIVFGVAILVFVPPPANKNNQKDKGGANETTKPKQQEGGFFTTLNSEHIMFIATGNGTHVRTVIDIAGHTLDKDGNIIAGAHKWLWIDRIMRSVNGRYFVGPKFLRHKHVFQIVASKENPNATTTSSPDDWVTTGEPRDVSELRYVFPRSVMVPNVEFLGMIRGNIRVLANFRVKNPRRAVFTQNGKFFDLIESYLRTATNEFCQDKTIQNFTTINKQLGGDFSQFVVRTINNKLIEETGIEITGASISLFDSSDKETQRLLEAKQKAELEGEAAITKAEKERKAAVIKAKGVAKANKIEAGSKIVDIKETVKELNQLGVDPNMAAQVAATIGKAQRITGMENLSTYVEGGGNTPISVPITNSKEKK